MYSNPTNTMAKARTLTFTFPDGKIRKVRTARNYSHAVKATFRVQTKFAYNGKYYLATEKHLCGRPDLMEKCVAKYSSLEGAEILVKDQENSPEVLDSQEQETQQDGEIQEQDQS